MSNRPTELAVHLINATLAWYMENNINPIHVVVNSAKIDAPVLKQYANEYGMVVLNIAPSAVQDFHFSDEGMSFSARFNKVATYIHVPVEGILGFHIPVADGVMEMPIFNVGANTRAIEQALQMSGDEEPPKPRPTLSVVK